MIVGEFYDVIIVGAGPAGLIAAAWMSMAGVKTLLIDKGLSPPDGHADGLDSRTFEILDTFGIGEEIWKQANQTIEVCSWVEKDGIMERAFTRPNSPQHLPWGSLFSEATLAQGRIESALLNYVRKHNNVTIARGQRPCALGTNFDPTHLKQSHPIVVTISDATSQSLSSSVQPHDKLPQSAKPVSCRYLLGCDGAHSWVREELGLKMQGERLDAHWGVLDCVPVTDFPDIRKRCILQRDTGNTMIIPREDGLVRFYIELTEGPCGKSHEQLCLELSRRAKQVLAPYSFTTEIVKWASVYTISQRLCETYSIGNRVFLAGDAVHTHSPKAGRGMNTSMQDAFNLGWKVAGVVNGVYPQDILDSYQSERLPVARDLLDFDRHIYSAISQKHAPNDSDLSGVLRRENSSASGLSTQYSTSTLVNHSKPGRQSTIHKQIGKRIPDLSVLNHSDARQWSLHKILNNEGRWTLLVFAGDVSSDGQMELLRKVTQEISRLLAKSQRFLPGCPKAMFGSIETSLIHRSPRDKVDLLDLPSLFIPFDSKTGFDYGKAFTDSKAYDGSGGTTYDSLGISETGALLLIRPDHHIAAIDDLDSHTSLDEFVKRNWL